MQLEYRLPGRFASNMPAFFRSQNEPALVEFALRQQLATYSQMGPRPRITPVDRAFWVSLPKIWSGWREVLVIVQPDTVIRWHRTSFRSQRSRWSSRPLLGSSGVSLRPNSPGSGASKAGLDVYCGYCFATSVSNSFLSCG
jgi:hypothetical protein